MKHQFRILDLHDTHIFAKLIAEVLHPLLFIENTSFVVTLNGDLGMGKTTLTRNIMQSLGVGGNIKSPTFTLVEPYALANLSIYHFDLYRFCDPEEWFDLGFDEYFTSKALFFIEWADKALGLIPWVDWAINLQFLPGTEIRVCEVSSKSIEGDLCLTQLIKHVEG